MNWLIRLAPGDRMPQLHIVLTWRQQHSQRDFQEGRKAVSGQEKAAREFWIARVGRPVGNLSTWGRKGIPGGKAAAPLLFLDLGKSVWFLPSIPVLKTF